MQYLSELPEITSHSVSSGGVNDFEVEGEIERLPGIMDAENVVFIGNMGGTIYTVVGELVELKVIKAEESYSKKPFSRINIKGSCVAFTIQQNT